MKYRDIQFAMEDGVGFITLNRPEKRNALSLNLMAEMIDLLRSIKKNREVRVVILKAEGSVFSSGHDLSEMLEGDIASYRATFDEARFATPGVRIGLFCHTPQVPVSRAIGRKKALEMLFTGRPISAEEAERNGLVNQVVPLERLAEETLNLARHIIQASPMTLALGKQSFYAQIEREEKQAYDYAKEAMALNAMTEDAREGISAFLQKRPPKWKGK